MAETQTDIPFTFTIIPWANKWRGSKWEKIPVLKKFTFNDFTVGQVIQPDWWPSDGQPVQRGFVCGPRYGLLVIDVDEPEEFRDYTQTGKLIGRKDAMSTRGDHYHIGLDYRDVPDDKWPKLGRIGKTVVIDGRASIIGADVKANGFVASPGCTHYSGATYEPVCDPDGSLHLLKPWPELVTAILADRNKPKPKGASNSGVFDHDTAQAAICMRGVRAGKTDDEIRAEWDKTAAHDGADCDEKGSMGDAEFSRHLGSARRKAGRLFFIPGPTGHDQLQPVSVGQAVTEEGPLRLGRDGGVWGYQGGVWRPDDARRDVIRDRVVTLLKNDYKPAHAATVRDVVRVTLPDIDVNPVPQFINCRSGLLDWRTLELRPHTPDVLSTVQLPVEWQPGATCPHFDEWLAEIMPPDGVGLAWDLLAYLCYPGNPFHIAAMLVGTGRNGKGTYLRIASGLLGKENISAVDLYDLATNRFRTAELYGKIANLAGDIDGTYLSSTDKFKKSIGNDLMDAERKFGHPFRFTSWAVPVFSANKIPASADTTEGYMSKWLIMPFPVNLSGRENRTVEDRLQTELPGILAASARRLPALIDRGRFELPESARLAKWEFERQTDQVLYWLGECTKPTDDNRFYVGSYLYGCYERWANNESSKPVKRREFYTRLRKMPGIRAGAENGREGFRGLTVTDDGWQTSSYFPGVSASSPGGSGIAS